MIESSHPSFIFAIGYSDNETQVKKYTQVTPSNAHLNSSSSSVSSATQSVLSPTSAKVSPEAENKEHVENFGFPSDRLKKIMQQMPIPITINKNCLPSSFIRCEYKQKLYDFSGERRPRDDKSLFRLSIQNPEYDDSELEHYRVTLSITCDETGSIQQVSFDNPKEITHYNPRQIPDHYVNVLNQFFSQYCKMADMPITPSNAHLSSASSSVSSVTQSVLSPTSAKASPEAEKKELVENFGIPREKLKKIIQKLTRNANDTACCKFPDREYSLSCRNTIFEDDRFPLILAIRHNASHPNPYAPSLPVTLSIMCYKDGSIQKIECDDPWEYGDVTSRLTGRYADVLNQFLVEYCQMTEMPIAPSNAQLNSSSSSVSSVTKSVLNTPSAKVSSEAEIKELVRFPAIKLKKIIERLSGFHNFFSIYVGNEYKFTFSPQSYNNPSLLSTVYISHSERLPTTHPSDQPIQEVTLSLTCNRDGTIQKIHCSNSRFNDFYGRLRPEYATRYINVLNQAFAKCDH